MRIGIAYGREHLEVEVADDRLVATHRAPAAPSLADPAAAVRDALEHPIDFPALRRAVTPDDHIAVVVDEELQDLPTSLLPVLEHLVAANVAPQAITLVCPPSTTNQPWLEDLPDSFQEVRLEVHDPTERKRLSYLATTKQGRRIYLNRTVVEADQIVVLSGRRFDPQLGYVGAEAMLYPALSDQATRQETGQRLTLYPGVQPTPLQREAGEVAWLLGAPFLIQVIEGSGSEILHVLGGPVETSREGQKLLDARWHVELASSAELVVASIAGDPARQQFRELARAWACAARVVAPGGRIVLLTTSHADPGAAADPLREAASAAAALRRIERDKTADQHDAFCWASAADRAKLYLLSRWDGEVVEEMFTFPLDHAGQVQRLIGAAESCAILPDAHKTRAVVRS